MGGFLLYLNAVQIGCFLNSVYKRVFLQSMHVVKMRVQIDVCCIDCHLIQVCWTRKALIADVENSPILSQRCLGSVDAAHL